MAPSTMILARASKAAKLLDLTVSDFRKLVDAGVLPQPSDLGGFERWRVSELDAIANGQFFDDEDFEP